MMWTKGQPWRVVDALQILLEQIRAYAPRSVPPATDVNAWGSIADDAHSSSSDHYPHFYSALGTTAVVCARDFPHAPALGLDGGIVTEALRISRDPRIGYLIFNRRITGPNHGWQWEPYDGSDPHDTHFHVSSVHTAAADDTRAWTLPGAALAPTKGHTMLLVRGGNGDTFLAGPQPLHVNAAQLADLQAAGIPFATMDTTADRDAVLGSQKPAAQPLLDAAAVAAALAGNDAFITAVANAVGLAVKDQFGPAFDQRVTDAARKAVKGQLDDDPTT